MQTKPCSHVVGGGVKWESASLCWTDCKNHLQKLILQSRTWLQHINSSHLA